MFKVIIHVTQSFETIGAANDFYKEVSGELRRHEDAHINGQVTNKFTGYSPEHPDGHEVQA